MKDQHLTTKSWERKDIILIGVIAILFILLFKQCNSTSDLSNQLDIQNHNLDALNDTIRIQKNRSGEDMFVKKTLLASSQNLEKLNSDLAEELKKVKGQVIALQKVKAETKTEIQYVPTYVTKYSDGNYSLDWKLDTNYSEGNYRKLSASSYFNIDTLTHKISPGKTKIKEDIMGFSFVTGLREKDKSLEIFVTPKYPGMTITSMEGAIVDPHKSGVLKKMFPQKNWSLGPYLGIGLVTGSTFTGKPILGGGLSVGISVQYSLFKF